MIVAGGALISPASREPIKARYDWVGAWPRQVPRDANESRLQVVPLLLTLLRLVLARISRERVLRRDCACEQLLQFRPTKRIC